MASIQKTATGYRARYRDQDKREHLKRFKLKKDAQAWLDQETAKLQTGTWVAPKTAKITVAQWCERWLANHSDRRPNTVRMAKIYCAKITAEFGGRRLDAVRPSDIQAWMGKLRAEGLADSYLNVLHSQFAQLYTDAIHDGLVSRSPLSRRTSPPRGRQRQYVASEAQIWALHDALEPRFRAGLLLGAFAGLRISEVCGLRVQDVDFMRGVVHPTFQYPDDPLKTEASRTPIPVGDRMARTLSQHVAEFGGDEFVMTDEASRQMGPWKLERALRVARADIAGLPEGFRFHDLRHFYASLLISLGLDIKTVQTRLRHATAGTTLNIYGHMFPDQDETTRAAIDGVMARRPENPAASSRPAQATASVLPLVR